LSDHPDAYPLVTHAALDQVLAWRQGQSITVAQFLADVARLAAALPAGNHVFNVCADRYRFTVGLAAALVTGRVSLLPPGQTPETVRQMKAFAPDAFCLTDGATAIDLPLFIFDEATLPAWPGAQAGATVPLIPAGRTLAFVFTSGSTGQPVPHRKTWGQMVRNVQTGAVVLALPGGARPQVVGTVPPQHMYGIESTVLLPLQSGGALCAGHPFYPADICAALAEVPRPRVLVSTPVHLRALLDAGVDVPAVDLVLSATAPLSAELAARVEARLKAPLEEIYGSTETGQIAHRRSTQTPEWTLLPQISLSERAGRFWASGGHVDPETPLGDVLELTQERRFRLHGRIGDMVNIAGKRSSLAYLNHQLLAIEGVVDGLFFMPPDEAPDGVTRLAAFAVAPGLSLVALRAALRERIDPIFMPRPLVLLDLLPRDSTGKLTRERIETLAAAHLRRGDAQGRDLDGV
jgi:acyl-coenzyme A synthetase/AMP-(fatty) acid ligase